MRRRRLHVEQRLPHDPLGGKHFSNGIVEMTVVNRFEGIAAGFGRGRHCGLEHGIPDVPATGLELLGERAEIDVVCDWRPGVQLDPPDLLSLD